MIKKLLKWWHDRRERAIEAQFKLAFSLYVARFGWTVCPQDTEKFVFTMKDVAPSGHSHTTILTCFRHEVLEKIARWSRK